MIFKETSFWDTTFFDLQENFVVVGDYVQMRNRYCRFLIEFVNTS